MKKRIVSLLMALALCLSLLPTAALAAEGEGAIEGAITGRALYEGNFTLAQALAAARGEE